MEKDIEEVLNMVEKPEFDKKDTSRRIRTGFKKELDATRTRIA